MRVSHVEMMNLQEQIRVLERRLDRVETKLYYTRQFVLSLLPKELQTLLKDYSLGVDYSSWHRVIVEKVLGMATATIDGHGYFPDRGVCPLCQGGSINHEGFTIPNGLLRHLTGSHKAQVCEVLEAANEVARFYYTAVGKAELKGTG